MIWISRLLAVMTGVYAIAGLRNCGKKILWRQTSSAKACAQLFAKLFKAPLLRQKNEAVAQTQNGKGRADAKPQIVPKLLGNGDLSLFTNLGRRHVFDGRVMG